MEKQLPLPLDLSDRERRQRLWNQILEKDRIELAALYAKLISQAIRVTTSSQGQEADREVSDR